MGSDAGPLRGVGVQTGVQARAVIGFFDADGRSLDDDGHQIQTDVGGCDTPGVFTGECTTLSPSGSWVAASRVTPPGAAYVTLGVQLEGPLGSVVHLDGGHVSLRPSAPEVDPGDAATVDGNLLSKELMREILAAGDGAYGVPRMWRDLRNAGIVINKKKVQRLMRLHGITGRCYRRAVRTIV